MVHINHVGLQKEALHHDSPPPYTFVGNFNCLTKIGWDSACFGPDLSEATFLDSPPLILSPPQQHMMVAFLSLLQALIYTLADDDPSPPTSV
jgi:hypothetical protein